MMTKDLIADSSFYICFMDDIDRIDILYRILCNFKADISPKIYEEISKNTKIDKIRDKLNIFGKSTFKLGELVKPFLSKDEIDRGEHEIIVLAYVIINLKMDFVLIIDDPSPRKYIAINFPDINKKMVGTVGFIYKCCSEFNILDKTEAKDLFESIKKSKFRVNPQILEEFKSKL